MKLDKKFIENELKELRMVDIELYNEIKRKVIKGENENE